MLKLLKFIDQLPLEKPEGKLICQFALNNIKT